MVGEQGLLGLSLFGWSVAPKLWGLKCELWGEQGLLMHPPNVDLVFFRA